jgi:hypothetical protein
MSYQGLGEESFTAFKKRFYDRIGDATIFDCDELNLLKVVLDGLKINYAARGRYRNQLLLSPLKDRVYRFIKRRKGKTKIAIPPAGKVLIGMSSRMQHLASGGTFPVYFDLIFRELGRANFAYVSEGNAAKGRQVQSDFSFAEFIDEFGFLPLTEEMRKLRKSLRAWLNRIAGGNLFTAAEFENIAYAADRFFRETCAWEHFIREAKPKRVVLNCHYHQEGLIAAARRNKVEVVELQHGLISPEDIFFIFPKQVEKVMPRALLPDRILLYGEFWKSRMEAGAEQICEKMEVGGFYHSYPVDPGPGRKMAEEFVGGRKLLLITSQYSMDRHYLDFAERTAADLPADWCIVLKPHPGESPSLFDSLLGKSNVLVSTLQLDYLLSIATVHVSIFSTTLFDAKRFSVMNFALDVPQFSDYVESMVSAGIAYRLRPGENPVTRWKELKDQFDPSGSSYYYQEFNRALFQERLLGE